MKKKIKDLTIEEKDKICHKYQNNHLCHNCPLLYSNKCMAEIGAIVYQDIDEDEVEVDG